MKSAWQSVPVALMFVGVLMSAIVVMNVNGDGQVKLAQCRADPACDMARAQYDSDHMPMPNTEWVGVAISAAGFVAWAGSIAWEVRQERRA